MNDQEIVALIRNSQYDVSLNKLYKRFPQIRKMILANGGGADDAEDIFQDALIILIRNIRENDFKLTSELSTYLFSVCRFLWKDELKKKNRLVPDFLLNGEAEFEEQEMEGIIERENQAKLAEKVISELKERCRELLLLFYEGQMKLKDIAIKMGYNSENTAKNQKYKCLEGAKKRLNELKQAI